LTISDDARGLSGPRDSLWQLAPIAAITLLLASLFRYTLFALTQGDWEFMSFINAFCEQDCSWYTSIYERGYDGTIGGASSAAQANWAFFPAYPILVSLVGKPLGLSANLAGYIVSNCLVFAAALVSKPIFGQRPWAYWLWVVGLLAGPFSFLFSALYTESLFVLLTVLTLVALQDKRYVRAGLAAGLLSAVRVTGVMMTFGILGQMLWDHLKAGGKLIGFAPRVLREPQLLLALALAPAGLALFMIYLHLHTGDALAFAHIQRGWDRSLTNPFETLYLALTTPVTTDYWDLIRISGAVAAALGLLMSMGLVATGRVAAGIFCMLALLVSLAGGTMSLVRFTAGLAPLGIAIAFLLSSNRLLAIVSGLAGVAAGSTIALGWFSGSRFMM
jgi:hypothetical protein